MPSFLCGLEEGNRATGGFQFPDGRLPQPLAYPPRELESGEAGGLFKGFLLGASDTDLKEFFAAFA
jgi:hypothetical protein